MSRYRYQVSVVLVCLCMVLSVSVVRALLVPVPSTIYPDLSPTAAQPYILEVPANDWDYFIGKLSNGSYFVVNGSNGDRFGLGSNVSAFFESSVDSLPSGGKVVFGYGSYSVTTSLNYSYGGVEVWGMGEGTVLELDADVDMFTCNGVVGIALFHVVCDGNNRAYNLVHWVDSIQGRVEYCTFYDVTVDFVVMGAGANSYYNTFAHNVIMDKGGGSMSVNSGAGLVFSQDGYVYDNSIDCSYGGDGLLYTGISLTGPGSLVYGNHITYNLNYSVSVSSSGNSLSDNWFDSPYVAGVRVNSLDGLTVCGNTFYDCGWNGGYMLDINGVSSNMTISGNSFRRGGTGDGAAACIAINTDGVGNCTGTGNYMDEDIVEDVWMNPACSGTLTVLNMNGDFNYYVAP